MRFSNVFFGLLVTSIALSASACRVSVETKNRYTVDTGASTEKTDTQDWDGESIAIEIQGVGIAVNGGVKVVADPAATRVTAKARFLAMAFEKADADAAIGSVEPTYALTRTGSGTTGQITLVCAHAAQDFGSADKGSSGCEYVEVRVPTGSTARPLHVKVLSGNGTLTLNLSGASIGPINGVTNIEANSNGGEIEADLPATTGGKISLVAEKDDITAKLPADFAADNVILAADADQIALGPYTNIKNGQGAGGRGTAGTGLALLHLTSKTFAGSTGKITLR